LLEAHKQSKRHRSYPFDFVINIPLLVDASEHLSSTAVNAVKASDAVASTRLLDAVVHGFIVVVVVHCFVLVLDNCLRNVVDQCEIVMKSCGNQGKEQPLPRPNQSRTGSKPFMWKNEMSRFDRLMGVDCFFNPGLKCPNA
jgi:hypothetical protein